ncbi:MAG: serine/threonine protein kinase [Acidobacteriaceae bacterium]|nr:serine/threonine protein kinase [Acidobacteriaceae bacterium]
MSLQVGQVVGDYEVIGVIGHGGMGSVYKVRNVLSDRQDAMKVLLPDLRGSADLADRFLNEIKVLASLEHPNIASLYTALRVNNQLLMVMEYVDGTNLEDRLQGGEALPLPEAVGYTRQVLSALGYAHSRGVVHRDIKPANIAINRRQQVKLLDFGIARGASGRQLTRTGMVLGSLYYMSPEQVTGEHADSRSDLYSVGITLYRALTGKRPIEGDSEYSVMRAQVNEMPPPPRNLKADLPEGLSQVVMRSLAKRREERYQTAEAFGLALQPYLSSTEVPRPAQADFDATLVANTPLPSSTLFTTATLSALQKHLAIALGPIAGAVIRKATRTAASLPELCTALSNEISSAADRRAFLRSVAKELGPEALGEAAHQLTIATPLPGNTPVPGQAPNWDPAMLNQIKKHLAGYIGPLARVMVDRASKKAQSLDEMFSLLSAEIPSPKDRERFLASRAHISG